MHKTILFQLALAFILALNSSNLMAQTDGVTTPQPRQRQYTKEHPLVYEDVANTRKNIRWFMRTSGTCGLTLSSTTTANQRDIILT